jgi:hypothetical protein
MIPPFLTGVRISKSPIIPGRGSGTYLSIVFSLVYYFFFFFSTWILFLGGFPLLGRVDEEVVFPFDVGTEYIYIFFGHLKENSKPSLWKSK